MDQREDYAELDARPPWVLRFMLRRVLPIGTVILVLVTVLVISAITKVSDRHYSIHLSLSRARTLVEACRIYRQQCPGGKYPATLAELRKPPPGYGPFLGDPERDCIDAWEIPFRYGLVPNETGELEPYVWTERTRDGKTTLIGAKLAADGTVTLFGRPDD
jgi:hypothetical protein